MSEQRGLLLLEDGTVLGGRLFGGPPEASGEVVFNTGMVGYPEALTDPSYAGQILVFTFPLIGNYGVPDSSIDALGLDTSFESDRIQVRGIVVANESNDSSHRTAATSLAQWLDKAGVPGIAEVDTRALTRRLRERGTMLGQILANSQDSLPWHDPNLENLVAGVSVKEPMTYGTDGPRIGLVDTGVKHNIIRCIVRAGARVLRLPWDFDFLSEDLDAVFLGNGPGDPKLLEPLIGHVRRALELDIPIFGLCLGNQIMALAAGADTYKLRYGHRSQNQPCREVGTDRCFVTSQNHGYAVQGNSLPEGWREWFVNINDGTNEGIRHESKPHRSVQFHPEATPGPTDTQFLIQRFVEMLR